MASKPLSGLTALVTALAAHVLHLSIGAAAGDDRKITFTNFMNSIRVATTSVKGFLSASDKTKLDGLTAGSIANIVEDLTPQLGGELDAQGNRITDHAIKVQAAPSSGSPSDGTWNGASTFDYADGPVITATRENPCTPSISNFPASGEGKVTFVLSHGTGSPAGALVTWTSVVDKWLGGSPPNLGTNDGDVDVIVVTTTDGGVTKYGAHVGKFS